MTLPLLGYTSKYAKPNALTKVHETAEAKRGTKRPFLYESLDPTFDEKCAKIVA